MQSFLIDTLSPELDSPSSSSTSLDGVGQTSRPGSASLNPFRTGNPPPLPRRDASGSGSTSTTTTIPPLPPRSNSQTLQSSAAEIDSWKRAALNVLNNIDTSTKPPDGKDSGDRDDSGLGGGDIDAGEVSVLELPDHLGMHTCVVCDVPTVACCPLCSLASYCSKEHMEKDWPNHSKVCRRRAGHVRSQSKSEPHEVGTPARHVVKPRVGSTSSLVEEKKAEVVTAPPPPADTKKKPDPPPQDLVLLQAAPPPLESNRYCSGTNYAIDAFFLPSKLESPRVVQVECQDVVDMHGMTVHIQQKDFKRYIGEPPYSCRVLDNRGDVSFIFIFPKVRAFDELPVNRSIGMLIDPPIRHRQGQKWRIGNTLVIVKPNLETNSVMYRFAKDTEEKIKRSINCKLDDWFD